MNEMRKVIIQLLEKKQNAEDPILTIILLHRQIILKAVFQRLLNKESQ